MGLLTLSGTSQFAIQPTKMLEQEKVFKWDSSAWQGKSVELNGFPIFNRESAKGKGFAGAKVEEESSWQLLF